MTERGHDLVRVGARVVGEIVGGHVRAQHFDRRAQLAVRLGHVGHVDCHEIHGDAADHGHAMPGEMHMRAVDEDSEIAVGIPQRDRGHAARSG